MNRQFFETQITKLSETFGKNVYTPPRLKLIWAVASNIPDHAFEQIVDHFIGSMRQAPLVPDFQNACGQYRETEWQKTKAAENFEEVEEPSIYTDEDRAMFMDMIMKRMRGAVPDDQWESFLKLINSAPGANFSETKTCEYCHDNGVYLCTNAKQPGMWAFRCHCQAGIDDPRKQIPQFKEWHRQQGFVFSERKKETVC